MQEKAKKEFEIGKLIEIYLKKNFLKTGSIFSNGLVGLGYIFNQEQSVLNDLYEIGVLYGFLWQLKDDSLDYSMTGSTDKEIGKDLKQNLISMRNFFNYSNNYSNEGITFENYFKKLNTSSETKKLIAELNSELSASQELRVFNDLKKEMIEIFKRINNNQGVLENHFLQNLEFLTFRNN